VQTITASALTLPPTLAADLAKHTRIPIQTGESGDSVLRFDRPESPTVYLKARPVPAGSKERPLSDESERLGWMHAVGLPVPAVLQYHDWKGYEYLLLTAIPGTDASVPRPEEQHGAVVAALAAGLRLVHGTNISACPFDQSRVTRLAAAARRVAAGLVREDDFDDERRGRSAKELYDELVAMPAPPEERRFTHGDFCLPNVILAEDRAGTLRVSGFVDCGNAGVADPYQDLALAARSVAHNLGPQWVPTLFAKYGLEHPDESKLRYYQILDEFF
jgi:aminoglycoside 3'-phosphotransferase-2